MSVIRRILVSAICAALGRGIVLAFGLDQKVAVALRIAMTPAWKETVAWLLAGGFGLIGLIVWELRAKLIPVIHQGVTPVGTPLSIALPNALAINVGDTEPYKVISSIDHSWREVVRVEVQNTCGRILTNCQLERGRTDPDSGEEDWTVLRTGYSLAPGDKNHTDVAFLDTAVGLRPPIMLTHLANGKEVRTELIDYDCFLKFRATATGSRPIVAECRLWLNDGGMLSLEKIS